jgi:hypothetical protein
MVKHAHHHHRHHGHGEPHSHGHPFHGEEEVTLGDSPILDTYQPPVGDLTVYADLRGAEPNYGAGDQGAAIDNTIAASNPGMDPFANAGSGGFGDDGVEFDATAEPDPDLPGPDVYGNPDEGDLSTDPNRDPSMDPFAWPRQAKTLRNPVMTFGADYYQYAGPAAVLGGETDDGTFDPVASGYGGLSLKG